MPKTGKRNDSLMLSTFRRFMKLSWTHNMNTYTLTKKVSIHGAHSP